MSRHPLPSWRIAAGAVALGTAALSTAVLALNADIAWRPYLMLGLFCVVPGIACWSRSTIEDPALWSLLVVATSLVISSALSMTLVWAGWWWPRWAGLGLASVCGAALASDLASRRWHAHV